MWFGAVGKIAIMSRTMAETLEYRFKEDTTRGTPLEITGPKALIDGAISSTRGPLFYDVTARPGQSVMGRRTDSEGNVTLDFDLNTNGRPFFHGPSRDRSLRTLAIIAQLDGYAHRLKTPDPRITFDLSFADMGADAPIYYAPDGKGLRISFERPAVSMEELAARMQRAMVRTADILHMYNGTDHRGEAEVSATGEGGLKVRMGVYRESMFVMEGGPTVQPSDGRIELIEQKSYSGEEQLVTICGVIAALDLPHE